MNILAIDTATNMEIIAVSSKNRTADSSGFVKHSHSITIFEKIDDTLKKTGLSIKDIELIGVGIGPGSFTGIRIAVTTARMFAQLLRIPLVGIKTHIIYASSITAEINNNILVAFDAKKERVFGALYKKIENQHAPIEIMPPGDYKIDALLDKIDQKETTISIGDGIEKYFTRVSDAVEKLQHLSNYQPSGETACMLIKNMYDENRSAYKNFNEIVPFYARKSDAEIAKIQKK